MSKFWDELGSKHKELLDKDAGDNFRNTVAHRYFTEPAWENEEGIRKLYAKVKELGVTVDINDSPMGNPKQFEIEGHKVSQDLLYSLYEIHSISSVVDWSKIQNVTEVGAGYGRTAYAILTKFPHIHYSIVDVSPAKEVSQKHLGTLFPGRVTWYAPGQVPPKTDLFLGLSSLSEVTTKERVKYIKMFKTGKYFYIKDWHRFYNPVDNDLFWKHTFSIYMFLKGWKNRFKKNDPLTPNFFEALWENKSVKSS